MNSSDFSLCLKLVRLHFPLETVKNTVQSLFSDFERWDAAKCGKSWFSITFFYTQSSKSWEFILNESQSAIFWKKLRRPFLPALHVCKSSALKFRHHWLVNASRGYKYVTWKRQNPLGKSPYWRGVFSECFSLHHYTQQIVLLPLIQNRKIIPCRWRHRTIVNGISEKHGGRRKRLA